MDNKAVGSLSISSDTGLVAVSILQPDYMTGMSGMRLGPSRRRPDRKKLLAIWTALTADDHRRNVVR